MLSVACLPELTTWLRRLCAQAEAAASRDKKGMHADKRPPPRNINDVSQASALAQAKQMFTLVQRAGVMKGVVQHVINGARYKVLIPSQTCIVTVALAGIRCPQTGRKDGEPGEPYGEEAYMFARDKCLQHDVEVEILAQDKVGAMISRMTVHGKCMASTLLENGYARMTGRDATSSMEDAQEVSSYPVVLFRSTAVSCFRIRRVSRHPESNWAHELSLILSVASVLSLLPFLPLPLSCLCMCSMAAGAQQAAAHVGEVRPGSGSGASC